MSYALEVRSSSFLAEKYSAFIRDRQQQAINKCTNIRNAIVGTDLGNLLRRKNETKNRKNIFDEYKNTAGAETAIKKN